MRERFAGGSAFYTYLLLNAYRERLALQTELKMLEKRVLRKNVAGANAPTDVTGKAKKMDITDVTDEAAGEGEDDEGDSDEDASDDEMEDASDDEDLDNEAAEKDAGESEDNSQLRLRLLDRLHPEHSGVLAGAFGADEAAQAQAHALVADKDRDIAVIQDELDAMRRVLHGLDFISGDGSSSSGAIQSASSSSSSAMLDSSDATLTVKGRL